MKAGKKADGLNLTHRLVNFLFNYHLLQASLLVLITRITILTCLY